MVQRRTFWQSMLLVSVGLGAYLAAVVSGVSGLIVVFTTGSERLIGTFGIVGALAVALGYVCQRITMRRMSVERPNSPQS